MQRVAILVDGWNLLKTRWNETRHYRISFKLLAQSSIQ
jgi:hypothetical protein